MCGSSFNYYERKLWGICCPSPSDIRGKMIFLRGSFALCPCVFPTLVLLRSPTITDDYSVHQLSHKALLAQFQRPWTITNVSSNIIERSEERSVGTECTH